MKLISHRGNIFKKNIDLENSPSYIDEAIDNLYDVEIDLWFMENKIYLGHDKPQYQINLDFLTQRQEKIWIHCKNFDSLRLLYGTNFNFFWHEKDKYTLTSKGIIWAYPGQNLSEECVCVMPETINNYNEEEIKKCYGICSDIIVNFK